MGHDHDRRVSLPLDELTDRQLHVYHIRLLAEQTATLKALEHQMADLNQSVADLEAAVDSINVRFATEVQNLQTALADANQALEDEELDDAAKDQALADALAAADAAASAIDSQVEELNAIGAEPDVPVEPEEQPAEETPAEGKETPAEGEPTEEEQPS